MPRINGIDLFCGAGGSSLGAKAAGITMVGAVDGWDLAARTYEANFPRADVVNRRLHSKLGPALFSTVEDVDLIIASPECTHHSIARGSRPRNEESRRSGWYVMPFVRRFQPRWIVVENVTGMKRWDGYSEFIEQLSEHYLLRAQVLDAADFGVPQTRKRLFILGDRLQRPPLIRGSGQVCVAGDILDPPGAWPARPISDGHLSTKTLERIQRGIDALGEGVDFLVVYYSSDRAGGWQTLDRPLRTLTTLDRFGLVRWEQGRPTFRMLQVPELRRAMGYPDHANLDIGSRRDKIKMLGNGVCPPVMKAVVEQLISSSGSTRGTAKLRANSLEAVEA